MDYLDFRKYAKTVIFSRLRREIIQIGTNQIYFERFEKICEISVT